MASEGVRRWLRNRNVNIQNEWLEACINFVKDDNQGRQLTSNQLNELVYEQWLMADIHMSTNPCLPQGLCNSEILQLDGLFCLQVNSIINVGESAYSQIQKAKGQDDPEDLNFNKNPLEPRIKPSRMLLLELTDGVQTICGMEYQFIPTVKVTTPPGAKVVVSGHVTCRLGTLLLTASNIKVLGGSVMQLSEENSFWNVLHGAIGQEPSEKPGLIKSEPIEIEMLDASQTYFQTENNSFGNQNNQKPPVGYERRSENIPTMSIPVKIQGRTGNLGNATVQKRGTGKTMKRDVGGSLNRDLQSWDCNNEDSSLFDDGCDDDLMAAIPDDDYFGLDEELDMEQLNQLENEVKKRDEDVIQKRNKDNDILIGQGEDFEIPNDDELFDDAFPTELLLEGQCQPSEVADVSEKKPLLERICSKEVIRLTDLSRKQPKALQCSSNGRTIESRPDQQSSMGHVKETLRSGEWNPATDSRSSGIGLESMTLALKREPTSTRKNNVSTFFESCTSNIMRKRVPSRQFNSSNFENNCESVQGQVTYGSVRDPSASRGDWIKRKQNQGLHSGSTQVIAGNGSSAPFVYLSNVLKTLPVCDEVEVRVKAYIATLVSHSQTTFPNWNVTVKLNDGSGTVNADLSPEVLTELLGCPLDEFQRELVEAKKTRNPVLCHQLRKKTERFQRNLACTSSIMLLKFLPNVSRPLVVQLVQPTSTDVSAMICRVCTKLSNSSDF